MTKHEFIFSNKTSHKVTRHLVFWLIYCTFFYIQSIYPPKFDDFFIWDTYFFAFLSLCCFAPVCIFAVYLSIYYLLPKTLQKKKIGLFVSGFILTDIIGILINYFTAGIFLNNVHYSVPVEPNFQNRIQFGNLNTMWAMVIATIAIGIKATKIWYLQQKENLEIMRIKTSTEMQLQKARLHPEFLLRSLDSIYEHTQSGSVNTTSMILNLSDLLSYSLYESDKGLVTLERELLELRNLIALEQLNKESLPGMQMQIEGEISEKYIAPMVIVKLIEETISLLHNAGPISCQMSLYIISVNNRFSLNLSVLDLHEKASTNVKWPLLIKNAQKRLDEYYSKADYQIELSEQKHETVIKLNLQLASNIKEMTADSNIKLNVTAYDPA